MIRYRTPLLAVAVAACTVAPALRAQTSTQLLQDGIRAYGDLEFEAAAGFLRQSLETGEPGLNNSDPTVRRVRLVARATALQYLAATEIFLGHPDSAQATFRQLVLLDVRYQPDRLVFPPEVTNVYDAVRAETKSVTVRAPDRSEFRVGEQQYELQLFASTFHRAEINIETRGGTELRRLYRGPIADSVMVQWDGLDANGRPPLRGTYQLVVTSLETDGTSVRSVRVPLEVDVDVRDTLPHPEPPADSLFLPERTAPGPAYEALAGGLLMGGMLLIMPGALASDTDLGGGRYLIGGAVSLAGITGFLTRRPGREIAANVAANAALRRGWQDRMELVVRENETRLADVQLTVSAGAPTLVEQAER